MESFLLNKEIYEIDNEQFKNDLAELMKLLKVEDIVEKPVRKLSLGERMKCELIAALLHHPRVLFLDEPTIGLDVIAQKNIQDFLIKYNREKKTTILLTSHYMADIAKLCRRIIVINQGKIVFDGLMEDLIREYALDKIITIFFEDEAICPALGQFGEILECDEVKATIRVPREKVKEIASRILSSDIPVRDIDIKEVEIEEIIRGIFSKKQ
mgnify:FL=1